MTPDGLLHMGVLASTFYKPRRIGDTVTVFKNNEIVSFASSTSQILPSSLLLFDSMVGDHRVLKLIAINETVTVPTWTPDITDTVTPDVRETFFISLTETVDPEPVPPTITDVPELTVAALNTIILVAPSETVDLTIPLPDVADSVTMVPQTLYQIALSDTIPSDRDGPVITEVVNTIST
jgi:hypothetical protein